MGRSSKGCSNRVLPSVYCRAGFGVKKRTKRASKGRSRRGKRSKSRRRGASRKGKRSRGRCSRGCSKSRRRGGHKRSHRQKKKCHRTGPKTNNPFLNYLRVFRKKHCNWPITKIAVEGAKCWCSMSKDEKTRFYKEACQRQKKSGKKGSCHSGKRSRSRKGCGRRRGRSRRRRSSSGKRKSGKKRLFNLC